MEKAGLFDYADRSEIYKEIVKSFEQSYVWLGRQVAEEALDSAASWNIQQHQPQKYRVRKHLLLYWEAGFLKSSLLMQIKNLLGDDKAMSISDFTVASLRGSVEGNTFVVPIPLKRPFAICTEFGQIINSSHDDLIQQLLNLLEEGVATVSLSKISYLSQGVRDETIQKYPIHFIDDNTFTYNVNWVLMAGTYNQKFLIDSALESRFNIVIPEQKFDKKFTKKIINGKPFSLDLDVVDTFRRMLDEPYKKLNTTINLPDELFEMEDLSLNLRQLGNLSSWVLTKRWWGIDITDKDIIDRAMKLYNTSKEIWQTETDKVITLLMNAEKTLEEIIQETNISPTRVVRILKNIRAIRIVDAKTNTIRYKLM